ncbi:MAG: hypothetical protein ACQERN_11045 [Thermodesulfobacteriota bacterium]
MSECIWFIFQSGYPVSSKGRVVELFFNSRAKPPRAPRKALTLCVFAPLRENAVAVTGFFRIARLFIFTSIAVRCPFLLWNKNICCGTVAGGGKSADMIKVVQIETVLHVFQPNKIIFQEVKRKWKIRLRMP